MCARAQADDSESRRVLAKAHGASDAVPTATVCSTVVAATSFGGCHGVMECSGTNAALVRTLTSLLVAGGRLALCVSLPPPSSVDGLPAVDQHECAARAITVSYGQCTVGTVGHAPLAPLAFELLSRLAASKRGNGAHDPAPISSVISHRLAFEQAQVAFDISDICRATRTVTSSSTPAQLSYAIGGCVKAVLYVSDDEVSSHANGACGDGPVGSTSSSSRANGHEPLSILQLGAGRLIGASLATSLVNSLD